MTLSFENVVALYDKFNWIDCERISINSIIHQRRFKNTRAKFKTISKKSMHKIVQVNQSTSRGRFKFDSITIILLTLLLVVNKLENSVQLRIESIEVPAAVSNGSQVTLACNYDLQSDQLYSVKWYKNYVEFYRFQPQQPQQPQQQQQQGQSDGSSNTASNEPTFGVSKQEFELDGISLNVLRSNSTHIYLRRTSLASEGNYKCEVSADSPSFTTVSLERRMKVYVLPKQKLTIIDNLFTGSLTGNGNSTINGQRNQAIGQQGGSTTTTTLTLKENKEQQQQKGSSILSSSSQNVRQLPRVSSYASNDIVNLTCISGPSRPAAQLYWYLNDLPIHRGLNGKPLKWFQVSQLVQQARAQPAQDSQVQASNSIRWLNETKSTLYFRLEPSLISFIMKNSSSNFLGPVLNNQQSPSIKLRCVAVFSVTFMAETSLTLSGGQMIRARNNRVSASQLRASQMDEPFHASLIGNSQLLDNLGSSILPSNSQSMSSSHDDATIKSLYRWQPMQSSYLSVQRDQSSSSELHEPETLISKRNSRLWNNQNIKSQNDHIERIIERFRPNEIEAPMVEAKSEQQEDFASSVRFDGTTQVEVVSVSCHPRGGAVNQDTKIRWLINGIEITTKRVNNFEAGQFSYIDDNISSQDKQESTAWVTHNPTSDTVYDNYASSSENQVDQNNDKSGYSNRGNDTLHIELTKSLLQLKELKLKCQTSIEQPMIELESHINIPLPGFSSIGRQRTNNNSRDRFQVRDRFQETQLTESSSNNNNNHHRQQDHSRRKSYFVNKRPLQAQSSSSSSSSSTSAISKMFESQNIINYYLIVFAHNFVLLFYLYLY